MLERSYRHFYELLSKSGFDLSHSRDLLVWICFPQQSGFNTYAVQAEGMDLSWLDGYYSTRTNRVAVVQPAPQSLARDELGGSTGDVRLAVAADKKPGEGVLPLSAAGAQLDVARLTHELAHQLAFNGGLQTRGVMYPFWVSEGLATNFEFDWSADLGPGPGSTTRHKCLVEAHTAGQLMPLRSFILQTSVPADVSIGRRYYAQAWAFFQFLLEQRGSDLRTYLQRTSRLRPGRRDSAALLREFTEAFGPPESLEPSWKAFLDRQARSSLCRSPAEARSPRYATTQP